GRGRTGGVAVGVELVDRHAWDAIVALAGVAGRAAARIGRVIDAPIAVVIDAVAALRAIGTGRPAQPTVVVFVVVLGIQAAGIVREIDLAVAVVVQAVGAARTLAMGALAGRALDTEVPGAARKERALQVAGLPLRDEAADLERVHAAGPTRVGVDEHVVVAERRGRERGRPGARTPDRAPPPPGGAVAYAPHGQNQAGRG